MLRLAAASGPLDAVVDVPGSKSIANRALVCAALADGDSRADAACRTATTRWRWSRASQALGDRASTLDGDDAVVDRQRRALIEAARRRARRRARRHDVAVRHRARRAGDRAGHDRRRPAAARAPDGRRCTTPCAALGVDRRARRGRRSPARHRHAARCDRRARSPSRGDVSSQYLTALMLIAPLLDGGLPPASSRRRSCRCRTSRLTAAVMASFGVADVAVGDDRDRRPAGALPAAATYDDRARRLVGQLPAGDGGGRRRPGPGPRAAPRRRRRATPCSPTCSAGWAAPSTTTPTGSPSTRDPARPLTGIDVDMADVSDLVPTLAAVAVTATTPTTITRRRLHPGQGERPPRRPGGRAARDRRRRRRSTDDGLRIEPAGADCTARRLGTHHDHRLAMAFGVLGAAVAGIGVADPDVVSKSWPGFWTVREAVVHP